MQIKYHTVATFHLTLRLPISYTQISKENDAL
jgi:hypothetical protein